MRKAWAVAWKELRQAWRDPLSLIMLLGIPVFMLVLYGYALSFDVRHVALAVQDRDRTPRSRDLTAAFVRSPYFDLAEYLPAAADLEALTEARRARAILVIPERFGERIAAGEEAPVQMLLDGADANTATTVLGYAAALVARENTRLETAVRGSTAGEAPVIDYRPRVWYNPDLLSSHFLVPGLIGTILMLTAVVSTALSVVREHERGTMEQLRVAPLRTGQILIGKTLPYLGISLVATALVLGAARLLFGVEVRGSHLDLLLATLLYLGGALGWGLLISTLSSSQAMAFQLGILSSLLPSMLLSGFVFPIRSMPPILQWVTYAVPARYYLVILRGIILKGSGLRPYLAEIGFLSAFTAIVLALAAIRMARWRD
jgi:ABC-2 type transport system permease protein